MILYKYQPSHRFFDNFKMRFTQAEELNDLFELVPEIRLRDPKNYAKDIVNRNVAKAYFKLLQEHPNLSPAQAHAAIQKHSQTLIENMDVNLKVDEIFESYKKFTNREIGILSLSETADNELMWAHYGDQQRGIVIGLDSEHPFFQPTAKDAKNCGELMNVIYTDTRPVVYVNPGEIDIPKEVFYTKKTSWSYEREWRMLKQFSNEDEAIVKDGKTIHLFSVPPEAVKEVIFGSNADKTKKQELIDRIGKLHPHIEYKDIVFNHRTGIGIR